MQTDHRPFRIGISGSYGGMNLGDEAILDGITSQFRTALPAEITVFSRDPEDTRTRHNVERTVPVREFTRREISPEIARLDLFVLGGGGILFDGEAEIYLREVFVAHELGIPVAVYGISAGPLTSQASRQAVRNALNQASVITVRDRQAYRLLEDVGVDREIHLTADPALLVEPDPLPIESLKAEGVDFERHLVGFSVREPGPAAPDINPEDYHALLANSADFIVDRLNADVVFVPMERTDIQHSHAVVAHMRNPGHAEILRRVYSHRQVLDLVGRFEFALGMRLHFLIFALLRNTPFAALPYASKVVGFLQDLGMKAPPLGEIGIGQLIAHIDRSWDTRNEIRAAMAARVPDLKARAGENNRFALTALSRSHART